MAVPLDQYLDATAAVVGLNIQPEYRGEVLANLERTQVIVSLVLDFLDPDQYAYAASVFRPGDVE